MIRAFSIRTYNVMMRAGVNLRTASSADCYRAAFPVIHGKIRNAGLSVFVELMRAAGRGVYEIYMYASMYHHRPVSVDKIRALCDKLDTDRYWRMGIQPILFKVRLHQSNSWG